ncbi:MAG: ABC transporter permease [Desulfobacteraceae bacterium]|nr:ABC transporter permease [Desulfobacteraceae bacterium]
MELLIFNKDTWQEIVYTIRQNRMRSLMTVFGVFWGIFMLIILIGTGKGLQNGAYSSFESYATNSFFIWARNTTKPYKGFGIGKKFNFTNDDTRVLRTTVPQIKALGPRSRIRGETGFNNVVYKDKTATLTIYGDEPEIRDINLMEITKGRFINRLDIEQKRKVAVIGLESLPLLFTGGQDPIGRYIRISGVEFQVVGVFRLPNKNDDRYEENSKAVFLPLSSFQQTFNWGEIVGWYSVNVKSGYDAEQVKKKVRQILARRHHVAPNDIRAFGSWNMAAEFKKMSDLFTGIRFLIWFVGIFSLLAGIIGISNIMLIVVKERTGEIGIKRALGATPVSIMSQLIFETLILTSLPGYIGLVMGVGVLEIIDRILVFLRTDTQMFENPQVDFYAALATLAVLTLGGVIAGIIPAFRAVQMKPVDALRQ